MEVTHTGKALLVEVAQTQLCYLCPRCEQLCILLLGRRHKRSCCVDKVLHFKVAQTQLCHPRQLCEQLRILLARL